jgi:hypothetical protein
MQMLSYLWYFNTPFSESNQMNLMLLYHAHPSAIITLHQSSPLISYTSNSNIIHMFSQAIILKKTSVFIIDTLFIHIGMSIICIGFIILRFMPRY